MSNNIEEVLNLRERFSTTIDLTRLIFFVIFVSHFCGCAWYFLATLESGGSWLTVAKIEDADLFTKYIHSLYWSVVTLLTVGYGDIVAV